VSYALENPDFISVTDHLAVYPNQASERDDKFTQYAGMLRRFETFAPEQHFSLLPTITDWGMN
jgi:hypothetical protein